MSQQQSAIEQQQHQQHQQKQQPQKSPTSLSPVITQQPQSDSATTNTNHEKQQQQHVAKYQEKVPTDCEDSYVEKGSGYIFHRNRELPTPNPNDPPIKRIKFYLDKYKIKEALQIFFHDSTLKLLSEEPDFMWDVIPLICQRLRGLCQYRFRVFEGCERMLCRIADDDACNPKEVLVSLLAEINQPDTIDDDNVFRAMIRPLESALLRMNQPTPREENFRWTLNVLTRHINEIELPQEYDIEGKKRQALPNDPSVKRFIEVLPLMLNFIEGFDDRSTYFDRSPMPILTESQIDEVLNGELVDDDFMNDYDSSSRCDITDASITALLHLIYRPFTLLDTTRHCKELALTAYRTLSVILKLMPNLFAPIYKRVNIGLSRSRDHCGAMITTTNTGNNINPESVSSSVHFNGNDGDNELTLATCAYIYRCDIGIGTLPCQLLSERAQKFPQILTHESLLYCHVPYIVALLKRSEILVHEKGLNLLDTLAMPITCDSLDQRFVDLFESTRLFQELFQIMVFSPYCENRRQAYILFTRICDLLTFDCKLEVFKWVLGQNELRPCIRAACIDQYRKHLTIIHRRLLECHQELSKATSSGSTSKEPTMENSDASEILQEINLWQLRYKLIGGQDMVNFLNQCVDACLPDIQHTDIIENYDLVLATLTIFRYLKLRKPLVKNEIEDEYLCGDKLKKLLFDPIRSAISLILTELKLHHKELVEGHNQANKMSLSTMQQQRSNCSEVLPKLDTKQLELEHPPGYNPNASNDGDDDINADGRKTNTSKAKKSDELDGVECLNWILCRLDLVESVLVKTCDLYNC